jgi:hypothetical protein
MLDKKLDELLDLLQKVEAKAEVEKSGCSFEKFVLEYGIRSGLTRVPNYLIYSLYDSNYKNAYGKNHFFRLMSSRFKSVRTGKQRAYLLDGSSFDLSREGKLKAKHYDKEKRIEKKSKKGR